MLGVDSGTREISIEYSKLQEVLFGDSFPPPIIGYTVHELPITLESFCFFSSGFTRVDDA